MCLYSQNKIKKKCLPLKKKKKERKSIFFKKFVKSVFDQRSKGKVQGKKIIIKIILKFFSNLLKSIEEEKLRDQNS